MSQASDNIINLGYEPRPLQAEIHLNMKRWNVLVCHRRFGKTVLCVAHMVDAALRCEKERPRFMYFAPFYRQAKQVAWDYLLAFTRDIPGAVAYVSELRVDLPNGARVQLFGADNIDAVRGIYSDGVILDEFAQMSPRMFTEVLRPALADREGWAIFIGTPAGRNAFYERYQEALANEGGNWYACMFKASETGYVRDDELIDARRHMSEDQYNQEFECSFDAAVPGAYYGTVMREALEAGRICSVPHDPAAGTEVWYDLGIGDSTALWFIQRVGTELHAIDYYENSGQNIAHYARVIADKPYIISADVLPHDAHKRSLQTGNTLKETLDALTGRESYVQPREDNILTGIERTRNKIPLTWFDVDKCAQGIECLRQYKEHWDDSRQSFTGKPYHNWTSHGADAFRIGTAYNPSLNPWAGRASEDMNPSLAIV